MEAWPGQGWRAAGAHSLSAPLGLTPAPACPGAADKSYQMEETVAVGSAVTGCLGMGGGAGGAPRDSGLNLLPAMLLWRRETGGTQGWFLFESLRSGIGWGNGRRTEGIEKGEGQRARGRDRERESDGNGETQEEKGTQLEGGREGKERRERGRGRPSDNKDLQREAKKMRGQKGKDRAPE